MLHQMNHQMAWIYQTDVYGLSEPPVQGVLHHGEHTFAKARPMSSSNISKMGKNSLLEPCRLYAPFLLDSELAQPGGIQL